MARRGGDLPLSIYERKEMATKTKIQIQITLLTDIIPGETANSTIAYLSKHLDEVRDMVFQSRDFAANFQEVEVQVDKRGA